MVVKLYEAPVDKQLKSIDKASLADLLKSTIDKLHSSDFSESDISSRLNELLTRLDSKPGILFAAIRIAVTGTPSSPELFGTLSVLGKEKSLTRLQKALSTLEK